jgi:hypothetical protein
MTALCSKQYSADAARSPAIILPKLSAQNVCYGMGLLRAAEASEEYGTAGTRAPIMTKGSQFVMSALCVCTAAAPALPWPSPTGASWKRGHWRASPRSRVRGGGRALAALWGARAAAVMAAGTAFSRLAGDRIAVVPDVAPCQPGQFCLRELPPLPAVLDGLPGLV